MHALLPTIEEQHRNLNNARGASEGDYSLTVGTEREAADLPSSSIQEASPLCITYDSCCGVNHKPYLCF
jgi:hypothetical protein